MWLAPKQVAVLPISDKFAGYAEKVSEYLKNNDIRTSTDNRKEKIGKKIRDAEVKKIPYMLIIGEKEQESSLVSVRKHGEGDKGTQSAESFVSLLKTEIHNTLN